MSLVNAAGSTQLVMDRFNVQAVFFTGIAGGVNPAFSPGDVVVPAQWRYHGETVYLNETSPGKYDLPGWYPHKYPNFGMIHADDVQVIREGAKGTNASRRFRPTSGSWRWRRPSRRACRR